MFLWEILEGWKNPFQRPYDLTWQINKLCMEYMTCMS